MNTAPAKLLMVEDGKDDLLILLNFMPYTGFKSQGSLADKSYNDLIKAAQSDVVVFKRGEQEFHLVSTLILAQKALNETIYTSVLMDRNVVPGNTDQLTIETLQKPDGPTVYLNSSDAQAQAHYLQKANPDVFEAAQKNGRLQFGSKTKFYDEYSTTLEKVFGTWDRKASDAASAEQPPSRGDFHVAVAYVPPSHHQSRA